MPDLNAYPYPTLETRDGSLTFYSEEFGQAFHNSSGAHQEAFEKYTVPCDLVSWAQTRTRIHLLDICFGLGYNTGVALECIWMANPDCYISVIGLERSPEVPLQALQQGILFAAPDQWGEWVQQGSIYTSRWEAVLHWGDARQTLRMVPEGWADAVFFDPFSPSACPELWTVEFFEVVLSRMQPRGRLATYSCSAAVRSALLAAGFQIGSTPPVGRPWPGTIASPQDTQLSPLSSVEQEHLYTRAAVPYRDPTLRGARDQIRLARQQEQQQSALEPTSAWKKRWVALGQIE